VRVESIGDGWAAFSALSGDTLLLNAESASVLEILAEEPADTSAVCAALAADTGLPAAVIAERLSDSWSRLIGSGLVRRLPASP